MKKLAEKKKLIAVILIPCILICAAISALLIIGLGDGETETSNSTSGESELSFEGGQILQCWNWSFKNISKHMEYIADQGFSAVQTSPIQGIKKATNEPSSTVANSWWLYYEPVSFNVETNSYNALGTFKEFGEMCEEAENYGVKVIVEVVLNHTANDGTPGSISSLVPEDLRNDAENWHDLNRNLWNETRWDITQFCIEGKADLNTGSKTVQKYATDFLKECIDLGADGFCFDKAKNIEVPADGTYASDFWSEVLGAVTSYAQSTQGFTPYYYGEITDGPTGFGDKEKSQTILDSYMSFMHVAQNSVSESIRNAIVNGDALSASRTDFFFADGSKSLAYKSVLLTESYESYVKGDSSSVSVEDINKLFALIGTRKNAVGLYFARPIDGNSLIGNADATGWANEEIGIINQFKANYMGQAENISASGSVIINERGTTGAVLVNCDGNSTSIAANVATLVNGTYRDELTGNVFTVYNGVLKGNIGETGIAVIVQDSAAKPDEEVEGEDKVRIFFNNESYGWKTVYAYVYNVIVKNAEWPGVEMKYDENTELYFLDLSGELALGNVVFTEHKDAITNRYPPLLQDGLAINGKNMIFEKNHTWNEYKGPDIPDWDDSSTSLESEDSSEELSSADEPSSAEPISKEEQSSKEEPISKEEPSSEDEPVSEETSEPEKIPETDEKPSFYVYFENRFYNWSTVYAYCYSDDEENATWPGVKMEIDPATGYHRIGVSKSLENGKVIFTENETTTTNRYPAFMMAGLPLDGKDRIFTKGNVWTEFSPSDVTIYFDNTSYKWTKVYAYVYNDSTENAKWPGVEMVLDPKLGYYKLNLTGELALKGKVLFTESKDSTTHRYPEQGVKGLDVGGKDMVLSSGYAWNPYDPNTGGADKTITVYFDNSTYKWLSVYAYVYNDYNENAKWPGIIMQFDRKLGYYYIEISGELAINGKILFAEHKDAYDHRYPSEGMEGLSLNGKDMIFSANYNWKEYVSEFLPSNTNYIVKNGFLFGFPAKKTVSALLNQFDFSDTYVVDQNNNKVPANAYVGTGYKICFVKNGNVAASHTVVIYGDVDGNSMVNSADYTKVSQEFIGKYEINNPYKLAADIDQNGKIDTNDCNLLKGRYTQ